MSGQILIVLLHLTNHETRHKVINDSRIIYLPGITVIHGGQWIEPAFNSQ